MNDPKRLFDEAPDELKLMIAAARAEAPSGAALQRTLAVTALGATGLLLAAEVSAAPASGLSLTALKWAGVGAVVGASTVGVAELPGMLQDPPAPAAVSSAAPSRAPARRATPAPRARHAGPVAEPEPMVEPELAPEPLPSATSGGAAPSRGRESRGAGEPRAVAPGVDPLVEEVRLLDAARAALRAGDLRGAEARLAEHRARFTFGKLLPEAQYLELEILERSGDHAGALRVARDLSRRFPDTPPAARARRLLERENR